MVGLYEFINRTGGGGGTMRLCHCECEYDGMVKWFFEQPQARSQGGCAGCVRTPPHRPKLPLKKA